MNIDGNQKKEGIFRGFFESFEKGVGGFSVQQVCRIDDEDLVASFKGLKIQNSEDLPDLGYLDLGRLVLDRNSDDIGMRSRFNLPARGAFVAKFTRRSSEAVHRFRNHQGAGMFADTTWTG